MKSFIKKKLQKKKLLKKSTIYWDNPRTCINTYDAFQNCITLKRNRSDWFACSKCLSYRSK